MTPRLSKNDPSSFANIEDAQVTNIDLKLRVDFDKKILTGTAILDFENKDKCSKLVMQYVDILHTFSVIMDCMTRIR